MVLEKAGMQSLLINSRSDIPFRERFVVPGDKSIGNRALILAAMAEGESRIDGLSFAGDCMSVIRVLEKLGASVKITGGTAFVKGWGKNGPRICSEPLNCGNSASCMRMVAGMLAAGSGTYTLTGDESLSRRSMVRLAQVLRSLGAKTECLGPNGCAPLRVSGCLSAEASGCSGGLHSEPDGNGLRQVRVEIPSASAQLKTAAMFASLAAGGMVMTLSEPYLSRDHSEIMLRDLGLEVENSVAEDGSHTVVLTVPAGFVLKNFDYKVCGDPSSAAFFISLALLKPDSHIVVDGLCINPTRMGFFTIVRRMNARICARYLRRVHGEMIGGVTADFSHLRAAEIDPREIPLCLDEIPLLAVLASRAFGITKVRGAAELRNKESDRISSVLNELRKFGVQSREYPDGFDIAGLSEAEDASVERLDVSDDEVLTMNAHGDHRLAMSLGVAACAFGRSIKLIDAGCCEVSYPDFWQILKESGAMF